MAPGWIPKGYDAGVRWDTMPALNFSCAGKRSIGLEIDSDEGYAVLLQLVARADVFITNMSADVLPAAADHVRGAAHRAPGSGVHVDAAVR